MKKTILEVLLVFFTTPYTPCLIDYNEEIVLEQAKGASVQLYFALETEKISRKAYYLTLLQTLETLLSNYKENEHWLERLPLLIQTRNNNQWLKS